MLRRSFIKCALAGTASISGGSAVHASENPVIESYRKIIRESMSRNRLTGASAVLVQANGEVWSEGFGYADRDNNLAMTSDTLVSVGSVTKTFTALALMQLRADGLLDIDRPVTDYVPRLRIDTRGADLNLVTVRAIMNHTSGLPTDVFKDTGLEDASYIDVVNLLNDTALAAWPQTIGLYSNIGYSLLGNVIQNVSGRAYPGYVKERILTPLGMQRSGFITDPSLGPRARLYYQDGRPTPSLELRDQPAGGLYSCADDLAHYALALMQVWQGKSNPVIDVKSVQAMFRLSNQDIMVESNKKGLGWFMFKEGNAFAMYHAGSTGFANASLLLMPQIGIAAAILINSVGGNALASEFAFRVLEDHGLNPASIRPASHLPSPAPKAIEVSVPASVLARHVGDYPRKRSFAGVTFEHNELLLHEPDGTHRLQPMSDGSFLPYPTEGAPSPAKSGERYRFADVGPYHVLFVQSKEEGDYQAGYRITTSPLTDVWRMRVGRYDQFGYQIPGAEQILSCEIEILEERLVSMKLAYNTGIYTYTLVIDGPGRAFTGGLGPETTGELVRFTDEGVMIYSGLTFRKD
jgi:CubicO group peptidase (beta-lactamase class C family)